MSTSFRNGLQAGTIFSILIIFLILIGFTVTAGELIADALSLEYEGEQSSIFGLVIFMSLLGVWAGATGAPRRSPDRWSEALAGALVAGLSTGLFVGLFNMLLARAEVTDTDLRTYLTQLSPEYIRLTLLGMTPFTAFGSYITLFSAAGLLGGVMARGLARGGWREQLTAQRKRLIASLNNLPLVQQIRSHPLTTYIGYGILLVILLALPLRLGQYWNFTLGTVGIYVLMGLGLNIVVGMAGLLDLGYVAFFAVGAYTVGLLTAPDPHGILLNFWYVLPLAILLAALAGILLGIPVLRLRGDYLAIVTLGFGEIIRILAKSDLLAPFAGGPQGVRDIAGPTLLGRPFDDERSFMYLIIFGILLVIFVTIRLQNSRLGRAWIAMREDETVAQAMGINTYQAKLLAFAIGAAFAGLGGVLFASRNQYTGPEDHNLLVSINVLSLVIVGGMGSIPGVIVGALALKGLPEILRQIEDYRILAFGALLVVMMALRPEGLWPSQRKRLELHQEESGELEEERLPEEISNPATPAAGGQA